MTDRDSVVRFLIKAKQSTYAAKGAETAPSRPCSHDLRYEDGPFMYYDTYLGGGCFTGEEALWLDGSPYWAMNYSGRVIGEGFSGDFLKDALLRVPFDKPFRGPECYSDGGYTYNGTVSGDFDWFQGYETISLCGTVIYECHFHGGIIL